MDNSILLPSHSAISKSLVSADRDAELEDELELELLDAPPAAIGRLG